jgi:hypothetical protein
MNPQPEAQALRHTARVFIAKSRHFSRRGNQRKQHESN